MASQCAVTQQQQIKQYLRKHKNKWREETKQTAQSPKSNIVENSSRSERVSTTNTTSSLVPKSKPRKPAFSSSRQQPVRRGKTTIDHLPDEIIHQIFTYLGANELLVVARICKRWHSLANDNLLWVKVFQTYVGSSDSVGSPQAGDVPFSYWKSQCIQRCVSQRNKDAVRQLRKPHPYTGLPRDTQKVLQQCGIKWLLVLRDLSGNEHELPSRDTFHFSMATVVRCYGLLTPPLSNVRQIKLYSLNPLFFDKGKALINSPYQRSLLLEVDLKWDNIAKTTRPAASDDLVNLYILPQGLMVATWKADGGVAFISLCLHQRQLVQRCLNGRPDSIFVPKLCKPQADDIDSTYGLHDYSCTVELHSQRQSIWSQQFRGLHCRPQSLVGGYAVLDLIRPGFSSDHSIISQKLLLPWKTDAFKGKLENVTLMDVTLLDDRGKPFWCVSSPVHISNTGQADRLSFDYSLEGSCRINYLGAQGKVIMELNWSPEREQFFITGLQVGVSLLAVNDWFSTNYK